MSDNDQMTDVERMLLASQAHFQSSLYLARIGKGEASRLHRNVADALAREAARAAADQTRRAR
jgi:hypothetical protein